MDVLVIENNNYGTLYCWTEWVLQNILQINDALIWSLLPLKKGLFRKAETVKHDDVKFCFWSRAHLWFLHVKNEVIKSIKFLVFIWRNHIPKLNITFPSEVLVLSNERPYRNLTFHNVLAWQDSSHCNRACLNFQAFEFVTWKLRPEKGVA